MSDTLLEPEDQKVEVWVSHFDSRHRKGEPCNQCDGYKQPDQGVWCDDCHGYTHMPWCPAYKEPAANTPDIECQFCDFKGTFAEGAEHRKTTMHLIRTVATGELRRNQSLSKHRPAARGGGDEWHVQVAGSNVYILDQNGNAIANLHNERIAREIVQQREQHHSLVAERELLRRLLKAVTSPTTCYCNVMSGNLCWHCEARAVLGDQKGPSA